MIVRFYDLAAEKGPRFREAWIAVDGVQESVEDVEDLPGQSPAQFVMNRGELGHLSHTETMKNVSLDAARELMRAFIQQCEEDGYRQIPLQEQDRLIVQYRLKTPDGTARDEGFSQKTREELAHHFAWRGLGEVLESERGHFRLNHILAVPDAKRAVKAALVALRPHDFTKLTVAVAPAGSEDFVQKYPLQGRGFSRLGEE